MDQAFPDTSPRPCDGSGDDAGWHRGDVRESMLLMASVRALDEDAGRAFPLRVRNLSSGGLMGESDRKMVRGERVVVDLRGVGEVPGSVAWAGGNKFGVSFDRAIDPKATRKPVGSGVSSRLPIASDTRRPGLR